MRFQPRILIISAITTFSCAIAAGAVQNAPQIASAFTEPFFSAPKEKEEVFIEANQLDYNFEQQIATASGQVEILKGETVLFADRISYFQTENTVVAEGEVVVSGPSGETFFTDRFVLQDDLQEGVINYFSARLSDGSLIAAAQARRTSGNEIELKKAVYSACPVCEGEVPLWQLKADDVNVDEAEQTITYHDAFMEVYGVPVLYTPYFQHPTPDADRKSGVLRPDFSSDQNLGAVFKVPYYFNIAPNMDLTLEPIYTSDEGIVAAAEFRHLTEYGEYNFYGSYTRPDKLDNLGNKLQGKEMRGHIKGEGKFDLSEHWKFGFNGEVASDDTYLRRYNFNNADLLTSRGYIERIDDRDYSIFQTVYFQGLLEQDNDDITPFAPIYTKNHYETDRGIIPGFKDSYLWGNLNGFAVNRETGEDSQRASTQFGVAIPTILEGGHKLEFMASVRGDYFDIQNTTLNNGEDYNKTRFIPEASVQWSMPLVNNIDEGGKLIVEPVAKVIVSSNSNLNEEIPNEDSQDIEFSHLNLFANNRYRGMDQVETGTRVSYGIRGGLYQQDSRFTYSFGQSYRFQEDNSFSSFGGLDEKLSDYVGKIGANFYNTLDFSYRFRLDKNDLRARRNEVDADLDLDPVRLNLNYIFFADGAAGQAGKREEISGNAAFAMTDEWSIIAGGRRNLAENSNIDAYVGLNYMGECVSVSATVRREFIDDRDVDSGTSVNFQLGLTNLGNL